MQKISTGVKLIMPSGCYARIAERSSMALSCISVGGRESFSFNFISYLHISIVIDLNIYTSFEGGVVDADYTGEVMVILHNIGTFPYTVKKGQRVAQLIFEKNLTPQTEILEDVPGDYETIRDGAGFGSTGE